MLQRLAVFLLVLGLSLGVGAEEVKIEHQGIWLNANLEKTDDSWPAGPVILMVHGTLAHGAMEIMQTLQGMFQDRGISTLAITLGLGLDDRHGMYDCATPHTHKSSDALDEIGVWVGWLKGEGVKELVLLGHSRGGNQVARYAIARPDPAVALVVLLAPETWDRQREAEAYRRRYGKDLGPLLRQARAMVARGEGGAFMDHVDLLHCKDTRVSAASFLSYYEPDENNDTPRLIRGIKAPVVVFAGSADDVAPDLIPKMRPLTDGDQVRLVVLDGAGHFFRDLYSEDIADIVAELLSE